MCIPLALRTGLQTITASAPGYTSGTTSAFVVNLGAIALAQNVNPKVSTARFNQATELLDPTAHAAQSQKSSSWLNTSVLQC